MSDGISTWLLRNLSDVFGENDRATCSEMLDDQWHSDFCMLTA